MTAPDGGPARGGAAPKPPPAPWPALIEDARKYPSPHNSQPIKVEPIDAGSARVYYDLRLGLPAESFGIPFGHVAAGVFLESLRVVAAAAGYRTAEELDHAEMDFDSADHLHLLGTVRLVPAEPGAADRAAYAAFLARQTSRRPYDSSVIGPDILAGARAIADAAGYAFRTTEDPAIVADLVHINQATLFDDLRNDAVYAEIMHWLRYSKREAAAKGDGLSAETMLFPGPALKFAFANRGLWSAPVVGAAIRTMYLNTMRGVAQLGWLEGPFGGPADYVEAGRVFMKIWLYFTAAHVSLHPFGTVITNPRSHALFVEALGISEPAGQMAWMLFRMGRSKTPPVAARRPAAAMLLPAQTPDPTAEETA